VVSPPCHTARRRHRLSPNCTRVVEVSTACVTGGVALLCSKEGSAAVAAEIEEVGGTARVRLPGISPRAYEHPADRGAGAAGAVWQRFGGAQEPGEQ
jgi:hypothetical protein